MKTSAKILVVMAVVLTIAGLCAAAHHFQLKWAVARYQAELKAKGELMELAQVIPPRASSEKNLASRFLAATSLLATNKNILITNWPFAMRGVAPGKALVVWQQPFIRAPGTTNSWDELAQALEENREAFKQLVAITNPPLFDFGLQYEQRFEMRITNLVIEKTTAMKLSAKTVNDLRLGQNGAAAENIHAILAIVEGTRDERTAISQLVRIAIAQIACDGTWEFLQSSNLEDSQLSGLQVAWSRPEFLQAMLNVLPVEREGAETMVGKWRDSFKEMQRNEELSKTVSAALGHDAEAVSALEDVDKYRKFFVWRYWWSYTDELRYLKGIQVLTDTMRRASTNGMFQSALSDQTAALEALGVSKLNSSLDSIYSGKTDYHTMLSESVVTLAGLSRKVLRVETARQIVITAIALKRFQLKHSGHPVSLNELVPEFVSAVPLDPVDGQPLIPA